MFPAFPKIFALGTDYISGIFDGPVEITEKIDGSQFSMGKIDGELLMRSKGTRQHRECPDKMFAEAVDYACSIEHLLPEGKVYYCEYLQRPRHNVLAYDRIPENHLILFGVSMIGSARFQTYESIRQDARLLEIEVVPVLYQGEVNNLDAFQEMLQLPSVLGGQLVEGLVVKNYNKPFLLGGQPIPIMAGKFVSERFKEVHRENWGKDFSRKSKLDTFIESFQTEARWEKAVQRLRDEGRLENQPKDIGPLIKVVHEDIDAEETEEIKNFLHKEFRNQIVKRAAAGLPEWYKGKLLENAL